MSHLPIYCINLARAVQRREDMQEKLNTLHISCEFVEATDERLGLNEDEMDLLGENKLSHYKKVFAPGELGCLISHLRCYQKLLASDAPYALILEDDASFSQDFMPVLKQVLDASEHWNLIQLGYIVGGGPLPYFGKKLFPLSFFRNKRLNIPDHLLQTKCEYYVGEVTANIFATHCYIINRECCEFMLHNFNKLIVPIDSLFNQLAIPLRLALLPNIAYQKTVEGGNIEGAGDITSPHGFGEIVPFRAEMGSMEKLFRYFTRISPVWLHRLKRTIFVLFFSRTPSYYRNLFASFFRPNI